VNGKMAKRLKKKLTSMVTAEFGMAMPVKRAIKKTIKRAYMSGKVDKDLNIIR
jgi:hypothetical protein